MITTLGVLTDTAKYLVNAENGISLANARRVIMASHGNAGSSLQVSQGGLVDTGGHIRALSKAGFAVMGLDNGAAAHGTAGWGGPAVMTDMDQAFTATGRSKVALLGYSMGGLPTLNWVKRNPTKVSCVCLIDPVTDLQWAYSLAGYTPAYGSALPNNAGWTSQITAEYTTWANTAGYRVSDEYATWKGLGIPIMIIHASDDTVVPPAQTQAFVTGVNDPLVTLSTPAPTGDHTGVFPNIPLQTVQAFYDKNA